MKRSLENTDGAADTTKKVKVGEGGDAIEQRFLVAKADVGPIIGKKGAKVISIRESSGAHVSILNAKDSTSNDHIMVIHGTIEQVAHAASLVAESRLAAPAEGQQGEEALVTLTLLVHVQSAGAVIGKAGATVKDLTKRTGAKARVSNDPDRLAGSTERCCAVSGTPAQLKEAIQEILIIIRDTPLKGSMQVQLYDPANTQPIPSAYGAPSHGFLPKPAVPYGASPAAPYGASPAAPYGASPAAPYGAWPNSYPPSTNPYSAPSAENAYSSNPHSAPHLPPPPSDAVSIGSATLLVSIPTGAVGHVIGKGASNIRSMASQSRTSIKINDAEPQTPDERTVVITGTLRAVQLGGTLLEQCLASFRPHHSHPHITSQPSQQPGAGMQ